MWYNRLSSLLLRKEVIMSKFEKFCSNSLKLVIGIALVLIFMRAIDIIPWSESNTFMYQLLAITSISLVVGVIIIKLNIQENLKLLLKHLIPLIWKNI